MRKAVAAVIAAATLVGAVLLPSTAAHADDLSTTTVFTDPAVKIEFGDDWNVPIAVTNRVSFEGDGTDGTNAPVSASGGTVDVILDGFPGTWATGLPLNPGGVAYLAQPADRAPLGSGEHRLTAIFQPSGGSGLASSKTSTPLVITVAGFAATAHADVIDDPAAVTEPTVRLSLGGSWIDAHKAAPAGTWAVTVTDAQSNRVVLRRGFVQKQATTPIDVPFGYKTDPGHTYRIDAVFAPALWVAPGLTLTAAAPIRYETAAPPPLSFLVGPLPVPIWLVAVLGGVLALLVAAAVVFSVLAARARRPLPATADDELAPVSALGDDHRGGPPAPPQAPPSGGPPAPPSSSPPPPSSIGY